MVTTRFFAPLFSIGVIVVGAQLSYGQDYPARTIRIVTGDAGGANDFQSRVIAQAIAAPLGQPVIIENRGGSDTIASERVAKALPDGYTLHLASGSLWTGPFFQPAPYDPVKDFAPITTTTRAPLILVINPTLPVNSVKELIALAKAKPGVLNYAIGGVGAPSHITTELFKALAGINIVQVIYKGGGASMTAVISNEVQLTFANPPVVAPLLKSGKVKALGITSPEPSALFPALPTVATGLPGYHSTVMFGIFAPARTPVAIINRLNQEIVRALNQPDVKEKFSSTGVEPIGSTPEQFAAGIKADRERLAKLIKDAGVKTN